MGWAAGDVIVRLLWAHGRVVVLAELLRIYGDGYGTLEGIM